MTTTNNVPKPEGATWTDAQWQAITAGGSDILVAAAAGSGKTAVLVERIIRKIAGNTDVDRLLVATFTKAAAAEMKERIRIALEKALEQNPDSEHLRRQLALMNRASITTLHSFCMDVIRQYYPLIGLDPGFRIANETEAELMRIDVLNDLFEDKYDAAELNGDFFRLVDEFGGERGDEPLYELVQELYDFSRSDPWPELWLRQAAAAFHIPDVQALENTLWVKNLVSDVCLTVDGLQPMLMQALDLTSLPDGPDAYADTLNDDLQQLQALRLALANTPWLQWHEAFAAVSFGKLKAVRGDSCDKQLQEKVKAQRDQVKSAIGDLQQELFGRTPEEFLRELHDTAPLMQTLAELVIEFSDRYESAKRAKGLLDFGDLEHYCLRILRDPASTEQQVVPSAAALEFQRQFDEILLDEYQDTNRVQEAIVALLAAPGPGNRFMVGDVKQSIYRFRLAEPNLFLNKYKMYGSAHSSGQRIDLARNFRSRRQVVDAVNDVFRGIMREQVAELDYDQRAELVCGAGYPAASAGLDSDVYGAELVLLDKSGAQLEDEVQQAEASAYEPDAIGESDGSGEEAADLQTAQLEARWIAAQIRGLLHGQNGGKPLRVYDAKRAAYRSLRWRDIVILLRATQQWAPLIIEELQANGIPAYAELNSGYFNATEVEVMLSLLRVIDNPYQDIPLAGVLRSPLFGLTAEQLAHIRIHAGKQPYFDAVRDAADNLLLEQAAREKLQLFMERLQRWREQARQGSLADLLWQIYRQTGYYDLIGGLPGGVQRQANLRALHDRARQYESTSFRGLFRFLRFIDRMQDSGGDLGTARALGEQEDVVRIMSIHKSKGLEFPVVFVAGLGKMFNMRDLGGPFLMHKQLGFGPRYVDAQLRLGYPTLPALAIRRRMRMEMLAEEMRILYVALTRPKEKLFLVGTSGDAGKQIDRYQQLVANGGLPDFSIATARRYIDWLLPMALLHSEPEQLSGSEGNGAATQAGWKLGIAAAEWFVGEAAASSEPTGLSEVQREQLLQAMLTLEPLDLLQPEAAGDAALIEQRLGWSYGHAGASRIAAKTSVTEMKRIFSEQEQDSDAFGSGRLEHEHIVSNLKLRRPRFMGETKLTAAERGTVSHLVMQHVPLDAGAVDYSLLVDTVQRMIARRLITEQQAQALDLLAIERFFMDELGIRLQQAQWLQREVPFSCALPAARVHPSAAQETSGEPVLIQGVIDCLFEDKGRLILLDYKTDRIVNERYEETAERHRFQLDLYAEAIGGILGRRVDERYVFFFDGGRHVKL